MPVSEKELLYQIALSNMPGVGDINAHKLIEYFGKPENLFREPYASLIKIPGIGSVIAGSITKNKSLDSAKKELEFINRYKIKTAFFNSPEYPRRLRECPDSPILLFYKGDLAQEADKIISIIGTRNATRRGKDNCNSLVAALAEKYPEIIIVSGLAYGVDICAHKAALKNSVATIGVMAHGFNTLYPSVHTSVAKKMLEQGALVTDFLSDTPPERNNFLKRNRIIAGLSDATLVIESGVKGGAMVTADIALSYNREVLAIPGFPEAQYSSGCNMLIKSQKASLIENDSDIDFFLNWTSKTKHKAKQQILVPELSPIEKKVLSIIHKEKQITADLLSTIAGKPIQHLSAALLTLEFAGLIVCLPGNIFKSR